MPTPINACMYRRATMRILCVLVLILPFPAMSSSAKAAPSCHIYRSTSGSEKAIAEILAFTHAASVEKCILSEGHATYSVSSPPIKSSSGVCRTTRKSVFQHADQSEETHWSYDAGPEQAFRQFEWTFFALSDGACPVPGSAAYIQVSDVSEQAFITIERGWNSLVRARQSFDIATEAMSLRQRSTHAYHTLRLLCSKRALRKPLLYAIRSPNKSAYILSLKQSDIDLEVTVRLISNNIRIVDVAETLE